VTFAVTLPACIHVPDNTRFIATYSEEYSLADVSRDSQTCLPRPVQRRQQKLIYLLSSETSETQLGVRTSHYIFPNNWGGKMKIKEKK
jgi:hypothetical protein